MATTNQNNGIVNRISGPVVEAIGMHDARLHNMVRVGEDKLVGEIIRLQQDHTTIQVYEDTSGLHIGEPIEETGQPLVAELGPGLMGGIFDGLQRPLTRLAELGRGFLARGVIENSLNPEREWDFNPSISEGAVLSSGDIVGTIQETNSIQHRIMVPSGMNGEVISIHSGLINATKPVAVLRAGDGSEFQIPLIKKWPVRTPRPYLSRLDLSEPLITGKRIIDLFFPIAKGGSAIIPGGFGTGKTVLQQSLARWSNVDVVVYVGCGERGNEMAEVLNQFPTLEDRLSGNPLIDRTVLIANTSNMPVAAREASIYMGITIAEYYRDMGYDVLVLSDSTSRWGEALREVSSRLEEIPGEEGYPAYMASRLAEFYERAGHVNCLQTSTATKLREGSISLIGAVSPPGGDFSDPITQNSMRIAGVFWALDYELSRRRHFPAINWNKSFALVDLSRYYSENVQEDFSELVQQALFILGRENELQQVVQLIGQDALSDTEREYLLTARILREDLLQQSGVQSTDFFCSIEKSYWMLKAILEFHKQAQIMVNSGVDLQNIETLPCLEKLARMKELPLQGITDSIASLITDMDDQFSSLGIPAEQESE